MIAYRRFRNTDPPELRRLWHTCLSGRGAATGFDADILESLVFAQPYFDPAGIIVAEVDGRMIGYVHAGFGPNADRTDIDPATGTICMVMVEPEYRRKGIGRELVRQAETYLQKRGATNFLAGPASPNDPFYFGLYGGSQPAGFLASDPDAAPFFLALGYQPQAERIVMQRQLVSQTGPAGLRLMNIRRASKLVEASAEHSWWWATRPGRLEPMQLALTRKTGGELLAQVTVVGLDHYIQHWRQRAVGLMDLTVPQSHRRQGYAQALLVEVCRRLREEAISLAEAHVDATDEPALRVFTSAGFAPVDSGTVYRKPAVTESP